LGAGGLSAASSGYDEAAVMAGAAYGDHGVRFNDDGRPLYPGQNDRPTRGNLLFWRRGRGHQHDDVDATANADDEQRYRAYSRTVLPQSTHQLRSSPFITRRFDAPRNYQTTNTVTTMRPEIIVVEEMKVYDEKPCAWWLFIIIGLLMFIGGILNVVWCWEYHWFSRFWSAILVRAALPSSQSMQLPNCSCAVKI